MDIDYYLNHENKLVRVRELDGASFLSALKRGLPTETETIITPENINYEKGMEIAVAYKIERESDDGS